MVRPVLFRDVLAAYRRDHPQPEAMNEVEIDGFLQRIEIVRSVDPIEPSGSQYGRTLGRKYFSAFGGVLVESRFTDIAGPEGSKRVRLLQDVSLYFSFTAVEPWFSVQQATAVEQQQVMSGGAVEQMEGRRTRKTAKSREPEFVHGALNGSSSTSSASPGRDCLDGVLGNCPPDCVGARHQRNFLKAPRYRSWSTR